MEFLTGAVQKEDLGIAEILAGDYEGKNIKVKGAIHTIRDMGEVAFIVLRRRDGLVQCVYEPGKSQFSVDDLKEADTVEVCGTYKSDDRSPNGFELRLDTITILSEPAEPMPLQINKWKLNTSLEAKLNNRAVALRNPRERATFRIQEGITRGFRDFLYNNGFTEIHTPKLGAKSAEGGANLFKLEYFHRPAILQQSPQFYKQMMVGVFDRVFETAPVFRAEKHNTKRHLNEYTSLDFEMGYIDGFEDIMEMETGFLQYTMELLKSSYAKELELLKIKLPDVTSIPKQPELRPQKLARYKKEYDIPEYDAKILTESKHMADIFEAATKLCGKPKKVSNWLMVETMRLLKDNEMDADEIKFSPVNLAKLVDLVDAGTINSSVAKEVFEKIFSDDIDPEQYVEENGLKSMNDEGELKATIKAVIDANPQAVEDYHNGKKKAIGALVGQTMKATKGKANPAVVNKLLMELL